MEIYKETIEVGSLFIELSVRKKINQAIDGCWVYCTARNNEGRVVWQVPLTGEKGILRTFRNAEDAMLEARNVYSFPDEDYEFEGLANKELDKTLYYLSLV